MKEADLPLYPSKPNVRCYAIKNEFKEYEPVGEGQLEIVTDSTEDQETLHFIEVKEVLESPNCIMRSQLRIENNYERQLGTCIAWTDSSQPIYEDLAISF